MKITNFIDTKTDYATHPCSDTLSLLLGDVRSQVGCDWLPLIYEFMAEGGERLEVQFTTGNGLEKRNSGVIPISSVKPRAPSHIKVASRN